MGKKVLLLNCAYHSNSVTDKTMKEIFTHLETLGAECEMIKMRKEEFSACINCRVCAQCDDEIPGECINRDRMNEIVKKIEGSDGYVIASPAKFYTTARVFKCFFGRLVVFSYWPFGSKTAVPKKDIKSKKALLVSAFPIPTWLARIYSKTMNQLKKCARLIGAEPVEILYLGMAPIGIQRNLRESELQRIRRATKRLFSSL